MSDRRFALALLLAVLAVGLATRLVTNPYLFFAGYGVLQYIVLASAWNILGGYAGYVNFGTAAFFALGAYTSVVLGKLTSLPVPAMMLAGGAVSGAIGVAMGLMTLRLRGVFFSICTLALAVVAQVVITNWDYVGGSSGAYVVPPRSGPFGGSYVEYLFFLMLALAAGTVWCARTIERSRLGRGLAAIRDDEAAAEALGVPTFRLKLIVTVLSGALMGMAGAPLPYYAAYIDPSSGFALTYPVNTIAMTLVGGIATWAGPLIGAVILSMAQQTAMVTISSGANMMVVGLLLVGFVSLAPAGMIGLARRLGGRRAGTQRARQTGRKLA